MLLRLSNIGAAPYSPNNAPHCESLPVALKALSAKVGNRSATADLRCAAMTLLTHFPGGRSSDYWCFWLAGFQAVMATDTGPLHHPYYHRAGDTPDELNFTCSRR
jgi:hypothetical protein